MPPPQQEQQARDTGQLQRKRAAEERLDVQLGFVFH
jgi:hypothetical protein